VAIVVILLLGVLWAVVLLPPILRSRHAAGSGGVSDFMEGLKSLGRHSDNRYQGSTMTILRGPASRSDVGANIRPDIRPIASPVYSGVKRGGMSPAQKRRRDVLFVLTGVCGFLFLLSFVTGAAMLWVLWLLSAAALGGYCYLLVQMKHRARAVRPAEATRRAEIQPLHARRIPATSGSANNVVLLRRSAGGY
jgi:hypothetical protein